MSSKPERIVNGKCKSYNKEHSELPVAKRWAKYLCKTDGKKVSKNIWPIYGWKKMHKLVDFTVSSQSNLYFETFTSPLYVMKFSKYIEVHMYHIKLFELYPLILNVALKWKINRVYFSKKKSCCRIPTAKKTDWDWSMVVVILRLYWSPFED